MPTILNLLAKNKRSVNHSAYYTNAKMHQSHIPQCTIYNRNMHNSVATSCIVGYFPDALSNLIDLLVHKLSL